jgi:hypothetical protein
LSGKKTQKNPKKPKKKPKKPTGLVFFLKKPGFFQPWFSAIKTSKKSEGKNEINSKQLISTF